MKKEVQQIKKKKMDRTTRVKSKKSNIKDKDKRTKRTNLGKELQATKKELEQFKDKYIRLLAEFDNYKKRRERELSNFMQNANVSIIEDILPIMDDFELSLNSVWFQDYIQLVYYLDLCQFPSQELQIHVKFLLHS